jgi:hypothetical protein
MVTDPNIILSGNQMAQPRLPDVNAMMQTRTAGMENIYAIEQQRAEQQRTAQKEQEAEAMKALSPAIAAAFSDPSDAGLDAALALVPPQYQGAAKAQLDQIRALPDPNRRKDLIRAGLVQDEAGRTLLGQLEMTASQRANFDIQRGQLEVSRANAAREAAAANQPPQVSPDKAADIEYRREKDAADRAASAAVASGEAPPVQLQKGERWNPEKQRVEAVPGSQTYNKQKSTQSTDYGAANNALRELEKVNGVVSDLKNTTGFQKALGTGVVMSNLPNIPGVSSATGAYDFQTKYKNLKGSVATLGRAAASLQGKLGNMAVQEWRLVSDAIANLDLDTMDADVLDNQLDIIANDIMALEAQVRDAYENEWGGTQFYSPLGERGAAGGSEGASDDPLNIRR